MAESRSNSFIRNRRSRGRSASDAVVVAGVEFIAENGEGPGRIVVLHSTLARLQTDAGRDNGVGLRKVSSSGRGVEACTELRNEPNSLGDRP